MRVASSIKMRVRSIQNEWRWIVSDDANHAPIGLGLMSEGNVARRISWEMGRRGWSQERMAKAMTDAGYPLHQSSVSKIVNPTDGKRRTISVDDAIGFAKVFDTTVEDLLIPLEAVRDNELRAALGRVEELHRQREAADREMVGVVTQIVKLLQESPSPGDLQIIGETDRQRLLTELRRWGAKMTAQLDAETDDGLSDEQRLQQLRHIMFGDPGATS